MLTENLNYRAEALQKLWPKRFDAAKAQACQRNPKLIATVVYSNRMGNRDEASGDAWRFIGLTEDEILLISADCASSHQHTDIHFARAIEAKLRSKNS